MATHKLVDVDRVYYQDFGTKIIVKLRTYLSQPVSVDSDWYLDVEQATTLKNLLVKVLECVDESKVQT